MEKKEKHLFSNEDSELSGVVIGAGFRLKKINDKLIVIYYPTGFQKSVGIKNQIDLRLLVVELVNTHNVTKNLLASALDISRQSIYNWLGAYEKWGYEGLISSSRVKNSNDNGITARPARPVGNKARQLEAERKSVKETMDSQNLPLDFPDTMGTQKDSPDIFTDKYKFEENRYAGSFFYWGIFQYYYRFMEFIESHLGKYAIVVYIYAMMQINGLGSIEQLKTVFKKEFGRILGLKKLFCSSLLWAFIHGCCELKISSKVLHSFYHLQGQLGVVSLSQLFIDGHFIPYYGKESVNKGFYTQRGMMMAGQTEIFVHDINGEIVYSEIHEGKGDMVAVLEKMNRQWTPYLGGLPPLLIVDRELWSVKTFLLLQDQKGRFVTWEKYTRAEELNEIEDDKFCESFEMNGINYNVYETSRIYADADKNQIRLRRIILWNKKVGKRMAVVTNDSLEESTTIAQSMLNRWGKNENGFKHMGGRIHMHYNPVLDLSKKSLKQMVSNPRFMELKKKKKQLKKNILKLEKKLLPFNRKNKSKPNVSVKKSKARVKLEVMIDELSNELKQAGEELAKTPEQIKLSELKEGKSFKIINTEGKNLWELSESLVWNSRRKLMKDFSKFLADKRDLVPVLEAITKCRGWIKSTPQVIIVKLEPLDTPRFRIAQIQLCRAMSERKISLKNGKRIIYHVAETKKCPKKMGISQ
jgi:hypothetical protein